MLVTLSLVHIGYMGYGMPVFQRCQQNSLTKVLTSLYHVHGQPKKRYARERVFIKRGFTNGFEVCILDGLRLRGRSVSCAQKPLTPNGHTANANSAPEHALCKGES